MEENENRQNTDESRKTMGLSLSDTAYYDVNAAEPETETADAEAAPPERRRPLGFLLPFICGAVFCALMLFAASELFGLGRFVTRREYDYYRDLDDNCGKYYEIMRLIDEDPVAVKGSGEISDGMLKEMVASTGDPYAEYFTAEEYAEFSKKYAGEYVGIGVGVVQDGDDILVINVFEDSPAAGAGIESGDVITKINGEAPEDVDDAIDMLSGKPGTPVDVTFRRGEEETEYRMNRAKIDQDSVVFRKVEGQDDIGYIRISSFIEGTDKDFKAAVKELKNDGCRKFIIDLRDNGGGLVDSGIGVADYLLPACTIMRETTKSGAETVYTSKAGSADIEYVVLVNGGTASASEILTAAIQDNNGGTVIGSKTYGKGVTQTAHRFADGSAVKLTVTEYFRPNGEKVNDVGITPDIEASDEEAMDRALEELRK